VSAAPEPTQRSDSDRRDLVAGYGVLVVAAGIAMGAVALVVQEGRDRPFDIVLLAAGALAVAFGWEALLRAVPPAPALASRAGAPALEPPPSLARMENAVFFACSRAVDAHMLLRPVLRDVAAQRLAARGVDIDRDARAAELLGPWAWALVRPDAAEPEDWHAPGLDLAALEKVVEALEKL